MRCDERYRTQLIVCAMVRRHLGWGMTSLAEWLASIGLGEYARRLAEEAVDFPDLRDLTEQDLKDLGLPLGHRRRMLRAIAELDTGGLGRRQKSPELGRHDDAERRQVTVLCCDMVGSTALSTRLDPEDMRQVIAPYQKRISEVIADHQGRARYVGDGVFATFGSPEAHEDDVEQAVRAGLVLIETVPKIKTEVDAALQIRLGIATGTVIVGEVVGHGIGLQDVVGETPNLAARLQALAEPGAMLMCANTHRLTEGYFECRDLGALTINGWTEPVRAWQVLGPSEVESRFRARHRTILPSLIGREEEVTLLSIRWRQTVQGEGRVVVLTGEPGIGKSHIALAFEEQVAAEPNIALHYFCSSQHRNSALFPFMTQLERAAQFRRGDSPARKFAKLEELLAQCGNSAEDVSVLANLLSLPATERYTLPQLTPQKLKEKTLAAVLAQLEGLAKRQPVLMVVEDVHWIDPTSLELLAAVVERASRLRLLLLVTARPEFTPPWPSYPYTRMIPLTRLGRRDGVALIERVVGPKTLPAEVMEEILNRTDGVPLFIEELTRTVLESKLLQERDGRYVLEHPLTSLSIPTTLQASLMARLDRLAPVREVAQIGAVAGRDFHYELLEATALVPTDRLKEALSQLVQSGLIFCRGTIPHAVYSFKHALVRDAAYGGLLKDRRVHLHAVIASAIEQQFPEILQTQPETLAHHLTEAGLIGKATSYWLLAGKNTALRSANVEAIAHLQRGLEVITRLPADEARDRWELDFLLVLGPCLIATQGPAANKTVATFTRARELCERLGDPPEHLGVKFWLATVKVVRGEFAQALEAVEGLPSAAEARGNLPTLINATRGRGMILMFMGRLAEARESLERAAEVFAASPESDRMAARSAGQDAGVAMQALTSWVLWALGEIDEAVARMNAALERAEAIQHAHTHAYGWYYASVLYALRGDPAIAQSYAERCLAISEQHGFRQWIGLSGSVRNICAAALEDSGDRLEEAKAALDEYQRSGYQIGITVLFVLLCQAWLARNETDSVMDVIERGLAIVDRNDEWLFEAELYRLKANALRLRGAPEDEVEALLDRGLQTARGQQARSLELRAATDLARLWETQGKRVQAREVLGPIRGRFGGGRNIRDLEAATAILARL
jgi:class 3 adenylate cyclase/tetratricopeptide (TPR) repeat protein